MVWIIIFICLAGVMTYIMFAPFYIEIDSVKELYRFRFHRLAEAGFIFSKSSVFLKLRIGVWQKKIDLAMKSEFNAEKKVVKKERTMKKIPLTAVKNILKSFRVKKCILSIDTGNMPMNGLLFPVFFYFGQNTGKQIGINFINENKVILQLQNNIARILWAFVKS